MPRGNDTEAHRDFATQYGIHGNAEALLAQHRTAMSPALKAANLKPRDDEASDSLDLDRIKPSEGGTVLSASVRGGMIVYVAEDDNGRTYKDVEPFTGRRREPALR